MSEVERGPHLGAGLFVVAAAWLGFVVEDTLLRWTIDAVVNVARTAKSSIQQSPAFEQVDILSNTFATSRMALGVLVLFGVGLVVRGATGKRRIASTLALVAALGALGLAFRLAAPLDYKTIGEAAWPHAVAVRRALTVIHAVALYLSAALVVGLAAHRRIPLFVVLGALVVRLGVMMPLVFEPKLHGTGEHPSLLAWLNAHLELPTDLVLFAALVWVARKSRPTRESGFPLRLLAFSLVLRIVGAFGATLWAKSATEGLDVLGAANALGQTWAMGLASALLNLGVLGAYASLPRERRSTTKVGVAMGGVAAAIVIDAWAAWLGVRVLVAVKHLMSGGFLAMADVSRAEVASMQTTLQIGSALSFAVGLAVGVVLVSALRKTAQYCEDKSFEAIGVGARFGTIRTLIVVASIGGFVLALAATAIRDKMTVMAFGVVLLVVALALVVLWVRALLGLARVLDLPSE